MRWTGGAVAAGLLLAACGTPAATSAPDVDQPPASEATSAGGAAARCVESYSEETLRNRAFAFDGTVVAVGGGSSSDGYVDVTFEVEEWFRGGGAEEVVVQMMPPGTVTSVGDVPYEVGTRLLVSGEPLWGGAPLDEPVAWPCGFTQPHSGAAASEWRGAFAAGS